MKENIAWIDEAVIKIQEKMSWVSDKNKNKIPYTTNSDGSYDDRSDETINWGFTDGLDWWTNGFWGGIMWLLYQGTNDQKYAEYAKISEEKLEKTIENFYGIHHDVGFMFQPTAAMNYRLTGNKNSRRICIHSANILAGRFNPAGNFIRAWNSHGDEEYKDCTTIENDVRGWAIVDCLMNLSQLYWATKETNDPRFYNIAVRHADTTMKYFVRDDGSVKHIVEFNPETGEVVKNYAGQGYDENSSWSRGQAWGLYGFIISYIHTNKQEYLDIAKKIAHYCISNLREDGLVPIDFRQPLAPAWEDSCGACIMASGLLEIARYVPELEREIYRKAALKILKGIYDLRTDWSENCDAIVLNCSSAYHDEKGRHINMVYADYFFIEAIYKLKGIGLFVW